MKTLRERNESLIKKMLVESEGVAALRNQLQKTTGEDPIVNQEKWNFVEGKVDFKKLEAKLQEADMAGAFPQFLRAGVQQIANNMYQATAVTYTDWVKIVQSNKDTEIYAPNHGVAFPREVGAGQLYPEVGIAALDLKLQNRKYGNMYALSKEFMNDDQTGSLSQQAGMMGEYLAILAEVLCYGKLASVSGMKYLDFEIPVSETKPSYEVSYPWSTGLKGGGVTKPASFGALTQGKIQEAIVALHNQKNLQGIKMMVQPKRLIISPKYQFDASVLMNSAFYPSGAAAAGSTGGAFAINPIKGILDITVSRFVADHTGSFSGNSSAWYLVDDSKPFFILQMREPVSIEQEAPNAGESFNRDIIRYKASTRMNADFLDPRFAFQGSDGSV